MKYQVMPDLTPLEYEALKADIANAGAVLVAIELDEDGAILDGHHRVRAWEELRQEGHDLPGYPRVVRRGMTEQQKRAHAYRLNTHRRHLTREQRDEVMRQMRADGATYQEIADAVGVGYATAYRAAADVELIQMDKVTGADGKRYPASYNRQPDDEHTFQSSIQIQPLIGADWAGEEETDRTVYYTVRSDDTEETFAVAPDEELAVIKRPHVANNSGNNEWYTPAEYLDAARLVMGHIDLDPASCALANQTVGALRYFSAMDDGLEQHWAGNVWMNPPYAAGLIDRFCAKYCTHVQYGEIKQGIVLVNNATETKWFGLLVAAGSAVVFPQSRVRFWSPDGTESQPLQGQAIIYSGPNVDRFLQVFGRFGWGATL